MTVLSYRQYGLACLVLRGGLRDDQDYSGTLQALPSIVFKAPDNGFITNFFKKRSSFYFSPIFVNSFHPLQSDGQYLMAIDESEKHTLSVWSWQEESVIVKTTVRFHQFSTTKWYPEKVALGNTENLSQVTVIGSPGLRDGQKASKNIYYTKGGTASKISQYILAYFPRWGKF